MNLDAIDRTIALIEKQEPEHIIMASYWKGTWEDDLAYSTPRCGFPACVGGWTVLANRDKFEPEYWRSKSLLNNIENNVADVLAISIDEVKDIALMNKLNFGDLLGIAKRLEHHMECHIDEDWGVIETFDHFPPTMRQQAAVHLLQIMKTEGRIDWLAACDTAATWFLFREQEKLDNATCDDAGANSGI